MKEMVTALISALISCARVSASVSGGWLEFWLRLLCSAFCCILVWGLSEAQKEIGGIDVEKIQGGEELQKLLEEARKDLKQIRQGGPGIDKHKKRKRMRKLWRRADAGFCLIWKKILKKSAWRAGFFTYYLDTAAGLLERYTQLQETGSAHAGGYGGPPEDWPGLSRC